MQEPQAPQPPLQAVQTLRAEFVACLEIFAGVIWGWSASTRQDAWNLNEFNETHEETIV